MNKTLPPSMSLPISLELHQQLAAASLRSGYQKEIWEIGAVAIREWLVRNDPETFAMPANAGYQWKHLFLPSGSLLRTVFGGKNFHALVEGNKLVFNGKATSPSGFANAVGGVRRNAWNVIWILFPNDPTWKQARRLRSRTKPPSARA